MINKRMVNTQLDCQSKLKENNKLMDIKTARIKVYNIRNILIVLLLYDVK